MSAPPRERLSAVDRAWLRMENDSSPMTILGLIELESPMSIGDVRQLLRQRLLVHPRFLMRFGRSRRGRHRLLANDGFELDDHVRPIDVPDGEVELQEALGRLAATLDVEAKAPWEILVAEDREGGALLIPRLHHSLADGVALIQVLVSLCDSPPAYAAPRTAGRGPGGRLGHAVRMVVAAVRLALLRRDPETSLKSPLTGEKHTVWSHVVPLEELRRVASSHGVTINDLVMAAVSGAVGGILHQRGEHVERLRAMVPFNLRPPEVGQPLGNKFGLVLPSLPVGDRDPGRRLATVNRTMSRLKRNAEGAAAYFLLNIMGFSAAVVESGLVRFFGRKSSMVLTNVPGPRDHLYFGGRRLGRIMFWVPQAGGIALGVSVISYAGSVTLGIISDAGSMDDPQVLVDAFEAELTRYGVNLSPFAT